MNTILFDLDGTLLSMDNNLFIKYYFGSLTKLFPHIDSQLFIEKLFEATKAMVTNTSGNSNEEVFLNIFLPFLEINREDFLNKMNQYYLQDFLVVKQATWKNEWLIKAVKVLKEKGYQLAIATNPIFPMIANHQRIQWAGIDLKDFVYVSCYEKNCFCKPNPQYYQEVLLEVGVKAEECMMVGNDEEEDLVASTLGIKTYLISDCLINRTTSYKCDYRGNGESFYHFVEQLPKINL